MTDTVLKQITALASMDMATLKATWKDLYKTEPPKFNRVNLERPMALGGRLWRRKRAD